MLKDSEIESVAVDLAKIYERLSDKQFFLGLPGDGLAYTASKIASMKARLADVKRHAEMNAKNADSGYKFAKATAFERLTTGEDKISATAAATLLYKEDDVVEAAGELAEAEAQWNFIKSLTADGHDMVEALRSRLIDMQSSRKDESIK